MELYSQRHGFEPQVGCSYASLMAPMVKNLPAIQKPRFDPWVRKIPWRREWQPTLVFLPGDSHGQRSMVGYSLWVCKESDSDTDGNYHK